MIKVAKKLTPGTPAPKSGQYEVPGSKSEVTAVKGKSPAADAQGRPGLHAR